MKRIWATLRVWFDKYPVIFAAVIIYLYYLLTSVNLFEHRGEKHTFLDYVMQFDSLIFMWFAAAGFLQLQRYRKQRKEDDDRRKLMERAFDRQQIYGQIVNEVTSLLQDSVNNPLAVISVSAQEIRRKFGHQADLIKWLDRIESSINRISITIRDLQAYETQKILDETTSAVAAANGKK